jgi:putative transposase
MITEHSLALGVGSLCKALGEPRSSYYRSQCVPKPLKERTRSTRRLTEGEERKILSVLNSERFADMAPGEVFATLLDEGSYYCSERTMYRILKRHNQNTQRRQAQPRNYNRPELLATRPNELWSWDITKLKGPVKWTYFYLYKIIDVYSRFIVGWLLAPRESASLAEGLISDTCLKQEIIPGTLTVHADNGSSMKSLAVGNLLADLGVTKTHSRPHVSNDNPYSEAAFKTLKYRPDFPEKFNCIEDARLFCTNFFKWYNNEHRHSGISMLTPQSVHYGMTESILEKRAEVLNEAYQNHPERFVKGSSVVKQVPKEVYINKPKVENKPELLAKN